MSDEHDAFAEAKNAFEALCRQAVANPNSVPWLEFTKAYRAYQVAFEKHMRRSTAA